MRNPDIRPVNADAILGGRAEEPSDDWRRLAEDAEELAVALWSVSWAEPYKRSQAQKWLIRMHHMKGHQ